MIRTAALFLAILLIGDRILALAMLAGTSFSTDRFVQMYTGEADADIVVLGNSRADRHFASALTDPATGIDSLNLALGGNSMIMSEILLRDYLDRYVAPKLVIIEPSNLAVDIDELGDMRFFGIYSERIREQSRQRDPLTYYASQVSHLYRFNSGMFIRVIGEIARQDDRLHSRRLKKEQVEGWEDTHSGVLESFRENEQALSRILKLCRDKDIDVRIVISPYFEHFRKNVTNLEQWRSNLERLVSPEKVHDYSDLVTDYRMFRDRLHLNRDGAKLFLQALQRDGFYDLQSDR